jgi:integrase
VAKPRKGIFKHKATGRWAACPTIDGQRRWFYGRTPEEVEEQVDEARHRARHGRLISLTRLTVEQWLKEWLETMQPPRLEQHSYDVYSGHIKRVLSTETPLGAIRCRHLMPRHLQLCYAELGKRYSANTIRQMNAVLHEAFERLVVQEMLDRNPINGVDLPKARKQTRRSLSREQVRTLLDVTRDTRHHALVALLCSTGLRIAEAAGLKWSDVDEAKRTLHVERQVKRVKGIGLVFGPLKSDSSYRTVRLSPNLLAILRKHSAILAEERLKVGPNWEDHGLIFPTRHGKPAEPKWLRTPLYGILERHGLPKVTPHQFRHTAATLLLEENVHHVGVQNLLGHSSSSTTLDTYSHVTARLQEQIAETMDALLFGS